MFARKISLPVIVLACNDSSQPKLSMINAMIKTLTYKMAKPMLTSSDRVTNMKTKEGVSLWFLVTSHEQFTITT